MTVGFSKTPLAGLSELAKKYRHEILAARNPEEAGAALGIYACDLILFMLESGKREEWPQMMPLERLPGAPDIIAVVQGDDTAAAEYAIQSGCWDALYLPAEPEILESYVQRCLEGRRSAVEQHPAVLKRDEIIGSSPLLGRLLQQLSVFAASDSSVLLMGETGTGKELFAKAIHDNSPRANKPMVVVDCTNLPASLAESLLFGHARGSFTGAVESSDGLFKQADGGTIFLDEIGELDITVQKSLLRVIQEKRFRPLSAKKEISCDFRIIAATNQDLESMVQQGAFRQDLYHRINTQTVVLPPLRDRAEDVPMLMRHYVELFCLSQNAPQKEIAPEVLEALKIYNWPGNIRELVNVANAAVLRSLGDPRIYLQHLTEDIRLFLARSHITTQSLLKLSRESRENSYAPLDAGRQGSGLQASPAALSDMEAHSRSEIEQAGQLPEIEENLEAAETEISREAATEVTGLDGYATEAFEFLEDGKAEITAGAGPDNPVYDFPSREQLPSYKEARAEYVLKMETHYLDELMKRSQGDFNTARKISGLSRARLYELLKRNRIQPDR
ncbi:MAG: sigma-54 dependent transcriptional regulator [Deltaproteobacteria bacterium]|nr:sigma-54 dependent transcriptional regulator [Deltaproteobacteria bacterium]